MSEISLSDLLNAPARQPSLSGEIVCLTGETLFFSGDRALGFQMSEGAGNGQLLGGAFSASCSLTLHNADGYFTHARSLFGAQIRVHLCLGDFVSPLCVFFVSKVVKSSEFFILSGIFTKYRLFNAFSPQAGSSEQIFVSFLPVCNNSLCLYVLM